MVITSNYCYRNTHTADRQHCVDLKVVSEYSFKYNFTPGCIVTYL